jgi:hypothetical protein
MDGKAADAASESESGSTKGFRDPRRTLNMRGLKFLFSLSAFGICYACWNVYDGFQKGVIRVPFDKWHHTIPITQPIGFGFCVTGWSLLFLGMGFLAFACVRSARITR